MRTWSGLNVVLVERQQYDVGAVGQHGYVPLYSYVHQELAVYINTVTDVHHLNHLA